MDLASQFNKSLLREMNGLQLHLILLKQQAEKIWLKFYCIPNYIEYDTLCKL